MFKNLNILIIMVFMTGLIASSSARQMHEPLSPGSQRLAVMVDGNDTVYLAFLRDIYVFPKVKFKNKKQEQFYWRTVRDVKKALPYAKIVSSELIRVNTLLVDIKKENERKKYLAQYEKEIFKRYEPELRKLTINQGRLLLKLIDRECNSTSYDLIKNYRGSVSAFFWQGIARIFGSNLKSEYDASGNDKIVERVILLVEAGQL
ncbi:hypothetical protein SDC9_30191 [bioreactor metagenome]|jgi:hypothetical protein|uniref:DUF4294 domain-containing protein n=1 Tax=bioreactor metagenome TaxID=1076179 RepID=A0A644UZ28_9ZZZZ